MEWAYPEVVGQAPLPLTHFAFFVPNAVYEGCLEIPLCHGPIPAL